MTTDFWRPFLSRIIASFVASFGGWIVQHWAIDFGPELQNNLTELLLFVVLALYSVVHRLLDKSFNPGDTASTHLAVDQKAEATLLKDTNPTITPGPRDN